LPYQCHSSSANCTRAVEALKWIGQSSSQHSKNNFWLGVADFL